MCVCVGGGGGTFFIYRQRNLTICQHYIYIYIYIYMHLTFVMRQVLYIGCFVLWFSLFCGLFLGGGGGTISQLCMHHRITIAISNVLK